MSPKEKAQELVEKYKPFVYIFLGNGMLINQYSEAVILENAKQCALIAVDEMLKEPITIDGNTYYILRNVKSYWQEIKQEIELL